MREFHDRHGCDGADVHVDARGGDGDSPQPRPQAVRDVAARAAYAFDYRQRVEAVYSADAAREPMPQNTHDSPPLTRAERAERMTREVELPASVRELPNAREVLPSLHLAELDPRKFSEYSLNRGHPHNHAQTSDADGDFVQAVLTEGQ
jgi:hypothetical protein